MRLTVEQQSDEFEMAAKFDENTQWHVLYLSTQQVQSKGCSYSHALHSVHHWLASYSDVTKCLNP